MIRERNFPHRQGLAQRLAKSVAESLCDALAVRPKASLVVSGGSTPDPFFQSLRTQDLPWDRVRITLADERWVATDQPESNEGKVRALLLQDRARGAEFVGLKTSDADPAAGCAEAAERIAPLRPFDVVVLGMGDDGHTASLFPHSEALGEGLSLASDRVTLATQPPAPGLPRMTLTLPVLLEAQRVVLHITGAKKRRVYRRALADGPAEDLPIRAVLRQAPRGVEVYWAP